MRPLKDSSSIPKYFFLCNLVGCLKGYSRKLLRLLGTVHLTVKLTYFRQLQFDLFIHGLFPRIFLFWLLIIVFMLLVQLQLTFTLFLSKILWRRWFSRKCLPSRFKKYFTIFVDTFLLKKGLNQIIFLFLLPIYVCIYIYIYILYIQMYIILPNIKK